MYTVLFVLESVRFRSSLYFVYNVVRTKLTSLYRSSLCCTCIHLEHAWFRWVLLALTVTVWVVHITSKSSATTSCWHEHKSIWILLWAKVTKVTVMSVTPVVGISVQKCQSLPELARMLDWWTDQWTDGQFYRLLLTPGLTAQCIDIEYLAGLMNIGENLESYKWVAEKHGDRIQSATYRDASASPVIT